jgi:sterol desaturase/sphingolipid hydroxylase (fatty acid hydroxylase superfamily)
MALDLLKLSLFVAGGFLTWPLVEYTIHGFLSHRLRTPISPLHWGHHKQPARVFTSPLAWVPVAALVYLALAAALGAGPALAALAGLLAGFFRYETMHWRFHFRAPRSERERRLRAHHLAHHFRNPRAYHGVTTRIWDRVFGSLPAEREEDYAAVADLPPLEGPSNLGQLMPR